MFRRSVEICSASKPNTKHKIPKLIKNKAPTLIPSPLKKIGISQAIPITVKKILRGIREYPNHPHPTFGRSS